MHLIQRIIDAASARQSQQEILISSLGAIIGIALVAWLSYHLVGSSGLPYIVASMGAAAVLLYAAPHSPLTRPWPFIGGHLISATVGVSCAIWIPDPFIAAGLAVGLAIFAMHQLNCLHPPGGAAALVAVIGGEQIHALGYLYVLMPVGLNVLILGSAVWLTRLLLARRSRHAGPFMPIPDRDTDELPAAAPFNAADLERALQQIDTYIDVTIDDLQDIYARAAAAAQRRSLKQLRCRDLMTQPAIAVEFGDQLQHAWHLMRQHRIKSLPVISRVRRVTGIITLSDFLEAAAPFPGDSPEERLQALIRPTPGTHSDKAEVVGQLMREPVVTLAVDAPLSDAANLFRERGFCHIPIIDHERRLAGMLSRSDLARLLRNPAGAADERQNTATGV